MSLGVIGGRRGGLAVRLAVLLAVLGTPGAGDAQQQQHYEVFGLSGQEALPVRRSPSEQSDILGVLGPQATGIRVVQRDGNWAQVQIGDRPPGWVTANRLRPAATDFELPGRLACGGAEPFWSLVIDGRSAVFGLPQADGPEERSRVTRTRSARNSAAQSVTFGPGGRDRAVIERTRICADGMSDTVQDYSVALWRRDGSLLTGCCRPQWKAEDAR